MYPISKKLHYQGPLEPSFWEQLVGCYPASVRAHEPGHEHRDLPLLPAVPAGVEGGWVVGLPNPSRPGWASHLYDGNSSRLDMNP